MAAKLDNYTSIADMQSFWLSDIAPQYFSFEDTNLYKVGIFGYINEVMSTITMDAFNTISIAKREFYASTAQNTSSYYKLAGDYGVDIPVCIPAACNASIYIAEDEIISNSTVADGTYTFILDNTCEIMADKIQLTMDYPIRILARYLNGEYSYTTYFDTVKKNSLHVLSSKYLQNKVIQIDHKRFLVISVPLYQYTATESEQIISKNSDMDTTSIVFEYDGELAGFDVFYTEIPGVSVEQYIPACSMTDITPAGAYCLYDFLADNKMRISFPKNIYFNPRLNGLIRCVIYTSLGKEGNFDEFLSDLAITPKSEDYPYNNNITIRGIISGKCSGGKEMMSDEDFIREIREKACTNATITTSSDLQIYFNQIVQDPSIRIEFTKIRDDVLKRQYHSFFLLKDDNDNVIPTNTLTMRITKNDFDVFSDGRGIIKPGKVFQYEGSNKTLMVLSEHNLSENLDKYDSGPEKTFLFTNPFLMAVSVDNGIVGYYGNSISEIKSTEFHFVEDRSFNQFICLGIQIERNPIAGQDYYTFTVKISASSDLDPALLVEMPDSESDVIRAKYDGSVVGTYFKDGTIWYKVEYTDYRGEVIDTEEIQASSIARYLTEAPDGGTLSEDPSENFEYSIGYDMQYDILDTFVQGDIIAKKKVTDLGRLRGSLDLDGIFGASGMYVPLIIEAYDADADAYTLRGYISTNDYVSLDQKIVLDHGVYNSNGSANDYVSVPMQNNTCIVSIFFKDDNTNYRHEYFNFNYFKNYTLTNQYATAAGETFSLVKGIDFIRSNFDFISNFELEKLQAEASGYITSKWLDDDKNIWIRAEYDSPVVDDDTTPDSSEGSDSGSESDSDSTSDSTTPDDPSTVSSESDEEVYHIKSDTGYDIMLFKANHKDDGSIEYTSVFETSLDTGERFYENAFIATRKILTGESANNYKMEIDHCPVVKSNWIKVDTNFSLFINKLYKCYDALFEAYFQLENQYGIALSLFNTYGKSSRYLIGNYHNMWPLDSVNSGISIGIEVEAMTNTSIFLDKYRAYIKNTIESFNDVTETGKSLYLLDILGDSKKDFPEIIHFEFYGFNDFLHDAQIISPISSDNMTSQEIEAYVPEFINVSAISSTDTLATTINIKLLNFTALT